MESLLSFFRKMHNSYEAQAKQYEGLSITKAWDNSLEGIPLEKRDEFMDDVFKATDSVYQEYLKLKALGYGSNSAMYLALEEYEFILASRKWKELIVGDEASCCS